MSDRGQMFEAEAEAKIVVLWYWGLEDLTSLIFATQV